MDQIIVKLKQHTPLLHFQASQAGATLRASEVKPRLDAFLREQGLPVPKYKMHMVAEGKRDVRPTSESRDDGRYRNIAPMFFGDGKQMVQSPDVIMRLTVLEGAFNCEQLVSFFAQNNFGTRQTKGYGSFTIESINEGHVADSAPKQYVSFFEMKGPDGMSVLKRIELLAKTLRGGINGRYQPDRPRPLYFKSLMFSYAKKWNCHWDKRNIKESFLDHSMRARESRFHGWKEPLSFSPSSDAKLPYGPGEKFDFRDCLGFSTYENWFSYRLTIRKTFDGGHYTRYKSPIVFKPIKLDADRWRVYVLAEEFPAEARDKTVTINDRLVLRLFPGFSVLNYLKFAFCEEDIASHFDNVEGNDAKVRQIMNMYSQLRANYQA